mmetsp:Transcript_48824/g.116080  ORF Transcript_48824/g.116080 Transcript_48824/m.116080 type:complete len:244 (-) Transcript_48824:238-969(-)
MDARTCSLRLSNARTWRCKPVADFAACLSSSSMLPEKYSSECSSNKMMSVATSFMKERSCATQRRVPLKALNRWSSSHSIASRSMWFVGSSRSSRSGCWKRAAARATRICQPPLRCATEVVSAVLASISSPSRMDLARILLCPSSSLPKASYTSQSFSTALCASSSSGSSFSQSCSSSAASACSCTCRTSAASTASSAESFESSAEDGSTKAVRMSAGQPGSCPAARVRSNVVLPQPFLPSNT